jgi:hypothetical protein
MRTRYQVTAIYAVPDFDRWAMMVRESRRQIPGVVGMSIFRSIDDPNEIMVTLDVESADISKNVISADELRELLDKAGVDIYPPIFAGELVDELSTGR